MAEGAEKAKKSYPHIFFLLAALLLSAVPFYALNESTDWPRPVNALISINLAVFILCGWDKSVSGSSAARVPEKVFLLLALIGGSPGLFLGINYFGHKSSKESFLLVLVLILVVQVALIRFYGFEVRQLLLARP